VVVFAAAAAEVQLLQQGEPGADGAVAMRKKGAWSKRKTSKKVYGKYIGNFYRIYNGIILGYYIGIRDTT
jgi:hypothetical protein